MTATTAAHQRPQAQPALREEHYRRTDGPEVITARGDLAELLGKIAAELREVPRCPTPQLITDTRDTVIHAEALLAAIDRRLTRMERATRRACPQPPAGRTETAPTREQTVPDRDEPETDAGPDPDEPLAA